MNEETSEPKTVLKSCFVISIISGDLTPERKHADMVLNGIIREVLNEETGWNVERADENPKPGMITDHVINDILNAELVVADLTFLNPNVFYEVGLRHMAELPIIHMASAETKLPFDNIPYRTLFYDTRDWKSITDTRDALRRAVEAVVAEDYVVTNPVTHARGHAKLSESADNTDQLVSGLMRKVLEHDNLLASLTGHIPLGSTGLPPITGLGSGVTVQPAAGLGSILMGSANELGQPSTHGLLDPIFGLREYNIYDPDAVKEPDEPDEADEPDDDKG